jgi:hypothetical protein
MEEKMKSGRVEIGSIKPIEGEKSGFLYLG